jgi:hypothetical protein
MFFLIELTVSDIIIIKIIAVIEQINGRQWMEMDNNKSHNKIDSHIIFL